MNIYDGDITAESTSGAVIGGGNEGSFDFINIFGGYIVAENMYGAVIGSAFNGSCDRVGLYGGDIMAKSISGTVFCGDKYEGNTSKMPEVLLGENFVLSYGQSQLDSCNDSNYVTGKMSTKSIQSALKSAKFAHSVGRNYVDHVLQSDGTVTPVERVAYVHYEMTENTTLLDASRVNAYFLRAAFTFKERLEVRGDVKLILAPGCILKAPKGIHVGENSSPASVTLGSGVTLAYGESAERAKSTVSEASGTPSEIGKALGAAKFIRTGEENRNEVTASVFSEGSAGILIGCCALLLGLFLGILIGRKTGGAPRGKKEEA